MIQSNASLNPIQSNRNECKRNDPLAGGLSPKYYAGANVQSDKAAARCLAQCHFKRRWDKLGYVMYSFWIATLLSPWLADAMYFIDGSAEGAVEDMFFNAMFAYYFACANHALQDDTFGKDAQQHFLPDLTFQNSMVLCGQMAGRCLYFPDDIPFMNSKTSERISELFFAASKSHTSGSSRLKDLIYGTIC